METKIVRRNIPQERENQKDRFRVRYNDKTSFKKLHVIVTRNANDDIQTFDFMSDTLPDTDSIHFTTSLAGNSLNIKWLDAQPLLIPEPTIIELQPEWFKMGYYVYIVLIQYKSKKYFYIGMTGDRKYKTARSPFYRMGGHFSQLKSSTQNQIIKGLQNKLSIDDVETALPNMRFTYYSYLIDLFDRKDTSTHHVKRKRAEQIESSLIKKMKAQFKDDSIFNKKVSRKKFEEGEIISNQLFEDFKTRINTNLK
jgi:hypothetical protein